MTYAADTESIDGGHKPAGQGGGQAGMGADHLGGSMFRQGVVPTESEPW
jgi:hypothetical protein